MRLDERVALERLPMGHRHPLPDARRAEPEELHRDISMVSQSPVVTALLDVADAILLVLNAQRQIVAFNSRVPCVKEPSDVLGLRQGEALACVNARGPGGCGAAPACETCGALGAVLGCQRNERSVEGECLMRSERDGGDSLELNVRATPVLIEDRRFTVVSLRDISSEKRREALEQIFFHDVLNTVTGLRGWTTLLQRPGTDHRRAGERVELLSRQLEREIRDHRALVLAESGALVPSPARVRVADLLRDLDAIFASNFAAQGCCLELEPVASEVELESDPSLLLRVLVNMVRNALEASAPGGTVRVWCEQPRPQGSPLDLAAGVEVRALRFSVRNEGLIPSEVRPRVFQRSFSTKSARGRGLGTYSMKLLGERYLGGKVSFVSEPSCGTVFLIELPLGRAPVASSSGGAERVSLAG
jgi:signal transduction histidine kinase